MDFKFLQPQDLHVNKVLTMLMLHELHSFAKARRICTATYEEIAEWVNKLWNLVKILYFSRWEFSNFSEDVNFR